MAEVPVTIIMGPRERHSGLADCIDSLYEHTDPQLFQLIVVQGDLPGRVRTMVESRARQRSFRFLHEDHPLRPNEARNLALPLTDTRWVVFTDNDVEFSDGWLEAMLDAGEATDAALVTPVIMHGTIEQGTIHVAGPDLVEETVEGRRRYEIKQHHRRDVLEAIRPGLVRGPRTDVEFHVLMARTQVFDRVKLDSEVVSKDHTDLSRDVRAIGGTITFEPGAIVGYVGVNTNPEVLQADDFPYYLCRFGDPWNETSFAALGPRWGMESESELLQEMRRWVRAQRSRGYGARYGDLVGKLTKGGRTGVKGMVSDTVDRVLFRANTRAPRRKRRANGLPV